MNPRSLNSDNSREIIRFLVVDMVYIDKNSTSVLNFKYAAIFDEKYFETFIKCQCLFSNCFYFSKPNEITFGNLRRTGSAWTSRRSYCLFHPWIHSALSYWKYILAIGKSAIFTKTLKDSLASIEHGYWLAHHRHVGVKTAAFGVMMFLYQFAIFDLGPTRLVCMGFLFFADDFSFYWHHRLAIKCEFVGSTYQPSFVC
jgi:hypothetical protein